MSWSGFPESIDDWIDGSNCGFNLDEMDHNPLQAPTEWLENQLQRA
jgi:hypothetical protein